MIATVNGMFETVLGHNGITSLDPDIKEDLRRMFFSGAAAMLHINNQIADIPDDNAAVMELARVADEIHAFAMQLMKAHS